ncbi:hypothetical protein [Humibacillus xanthopallidus]|uniref:hypothetical protein n=1 Tax=Humibacillus xanthopallidus TaxID=412689 RepID=UPI001152AE51|nr:hypothetical protein [Humibacillus xanthopallidus]
MLDLTPTSPAAARSSRRPGLRSRGSRTARRALAAVCVGSAAVLVLTACGMTDMPTPRRTVTVLVDAPGASTGTSTSSVPTVSATPTTPATTTALPTSLAVGKQRGAPHSYDEAKQRIDRATSAEVGSVFQSPTGNITCSTAGGEGVLVTCDVAKGRSDAPASAPCPAGGPRDIGRIELTPAGARPVCNSDTIRQGAAATLAYGVRTGPSLGSVACLSEEFGMTCVDSTSKHGFFLARDTFVTF